METNTQAYQAAIEALLSQRMGLNSQSIGTTTIAKVVAQTMRQQGFTEIAAYWQHLQTSEAALEALVDAIVVPETRFFRNPESFAFLQHYVLSEWQETVHPSPLRVLSLPCSTGEEPYSIAMTLLEASLPPDTFHIDAVDISPTALAKAQQGLYEAYSFRSSSPHSLSPYIQKYFQVNQEGYQLAPKVRSQVQFYIDNLAKASCLINHAPYDIIFCRNLLIYFHQAAQDRALRTLDRLLVPNGLLFVGYAETNLINPKRFTPIRYSQAFVYRKTSMPLAEHNALMNENAQPRSKPTLPSCPLRSETSTPRLPAQSRTKLHLTTSSPVTTDQSATARPPDRNVDSHLFATNTASETTKPSLRLELIRTLADQGELAIAAAQCDRYLQVHPTSATAYLLLGEIHQAQGAEDLAVQAFRKAIYLDPTCAEALHHLALLYEYQGNLAAARHLHQRLQRLLEGR